MSRSTDRNNIHATAAEYLANCRQLWDQLQLQLTDQQCFDLAESLTAFIYPKYRFSEFGRKFLEDQQFAEFYTNRVSSLNFHSYDRKYLLKEILKLAKDVPGDTIEVGVYEGSASYLIAQLARRAGKRHHLFDSFEGLSEPGSFDGDYWSRGMMAVSEEQVRANLSEFDNICYWRGWIPERFYEVADQYFSFLHVDVDIYQPTLDTIAFFYPRMSNGGIILSDDYGFASCPGARKAVDEFFADKPEAVIDLPTGQALVIVRR
jgi:O-methyltransferase